VVLRDGRGSDPNPASAAPFDRLLGAQDTARFEPLRGALDLRQAFFRWLLHQHRDDVRVEL
jgi:hypothetical protein